MISLFALLFIYVIIGGNKITTKLASINGFIMLLSMSVIFFSELRLVMSENFELGEKMRQNADLWDLWGRNGFGVMASCKSISMILAGAGFLGAPHLFTRLLNARNIRSVKRAAPVGILLFSVGDLIALMVGVMGKLIINDLADSEMVVSVMSFKLLPAMAAGFIFVGVIASIFSTADSLLILMPSAFVNDVYRGISTGSEIKGIHGLSRLIMLIVFLSGLAISFADNRLVYWMVNYIWVIIACVFMPLVILGVFNVSAKAVNLGVCVLSGLLVSAFWNVFFENPTGVTGIIPGVMVGFIGILIFYKLQVINEDPS